MRIVINATAAVGGGSITYLNHILPALDSLDMDNEFIVLISRFQKHLRFVDLSSKMRLREVKFPFPSVLVRMFWEQTVLPVWLRKVRADVLFAPMDLAPFFAPCPVVLAIRNLVPYAESWRANSRSTKFLLQKWITYYSAHRARSVIFVSDCSREIIGRQLKLSKDRTYVIYHGIDHNRFARSSVSKSSNNLHKKVEAHKPYVLSVSTVNPHKNFETLLRAWSELRVEVREQYRLLIAGRVASPQYYQSLRSLADNLGIRRNVVFLGEISHADLPFLYHQACAFVFPSPVETFGHPLLEAMTAGIPIVAANSSAVPEILSGAGLLFKPNDAHECATHLSTVLTETDASSVLVHRGRIRSKQFAWDITARRTVEILTQTARGSQI